MNDKLDRFLAQHRPEPPDAPAGQAQRIWNSRAYFPRSRWMAARWLPVTGTIAALLFLWVTTHPTHVELEGLEMEEYVVSTAADFFSEGEEFLFDL